MSVEATAVIKKESKADPSNPTAKAYYASLSLLDATGKAYGTPRHFDEFRDLAVFLIRQEAVTHEQLHEYHPSYQRGETVRIPLTLENDEALKNLGLDQTSA